jgi:ADP-ribose pyrophosphatase
MKRYKNDHQYQRNHNDVKIINVELRYQGFCCVEKYRLQTRSFDGSWTDPYDREIVTQRQAAAAIPYDPVTNKVVLIEQFRAAALEFRPEAPWGLEIVAGVMDKGSGEHNEHGGHDKYGDGGSFEELIRREMQEEAGVEIFALLPIYKYLSSPGILTECVQLYCAKVDVTKAPDFCGLADEHEDIRLHVMPVEEVFAKLRAGQITNASAIIAVQWLELNLPKVREQWL